MSQDLTKKRSELAQLLKVYRNSQSHERSLRVRQELKKLSAKGK
jgi:hypothetical protein